MIKANKLTPGSNLKWEASRMMLPEHRELFIKHRNHIQKKTRPELEDDQLEEFQRIVTESYRRKSEITLCIFDEMFPRETQGYVARMDLHLARILIQTHEWDEWIDFVDIIDARSSE